MPIYSLYIFDRHCVCIYYQDWTHSKPIKVGPELLPNVLRLPSYASTLPPSQRFSHKTTGLVVAVNDEERSTTPVGEPPMPSSRTLPFDEEAKLVYGVVFSLKNMIKKLSGRDEAFVAFSTSVYKLHFFETLTGLRFVLLSDPAAPSLRAALRQLYAGPFLDHVVRNPMIVSTDSAKTGRGIDNDAFRGAVETFVRSLPM